MSKAKVRVGIVGAGPIGGLGGRPFSHAAGYRRCEDAELVAIADIDPQRLQQFGEEWEIPPEHRYPTATDMYEKAALDVVDVTTNSLYHHQPVIDAAAAGIKVIMVEKPLATSVAWGRRMVEACEKSGARLITEHTRRFLPHYQRLKRMVDEGAVGRVKTITYEGCRPLLMNGTHTVDYAFFFTSAEPLLVSGYLNQETVADPGGAGLVACSDGVVVIIDCIAERREQLGYTTIAGTGAAFTSASASASGSTGPSSKPMRATERATTSSPSPICPPISNSTTISTLPSAKASTVCSKTARAYPQAATASKRSKSLPPSTSLTRPAPKCRCRSPRASTKLKFAQPANRRAEKTPGWQNRQHTRQHI